jgi:hypothetical protein
MIGMMLRSYIRRRKDKHQLFMHRNTLNVGDRVNYNGDTGVIKNIYESGSVGVLLDDESKEYVLFLLHHLR